MTNNGNKIGFIGAGAMGEVMIKAFVGSGRVAAEAIIIAEPREEQRKNLQEKYKVKTTTDNKTVLAEAGYIFLAIKPQVLPEVLDEIGSCLEKHHVLLSIAAGINLAFIETSCPHGIPVWRIMPNATASVGEGAIAVCGGKWVTEEQRAFVLPLLGALGIVTEVQERYMDAITGLAGSGPAFVAYFLQAMIEGGVKAGLTREMASQMALQTLYGTAYMLKEEKMTPGALKEKVTSPGGTTIYGLYVLEKEAVAGAVMEAVFSAAQRSKELSK